MEFKKRFNYFKYNNTLIFTFYFYYQHLLITKDNFNGTSDSEDDNDGMNREALERSTRFLRSNQN